MPCIWFAVQITCHCRIYFTITSMACIAPLTFDRIQSLKLSYITERHSHRHKRTSPGAGSGGGQYTQANSWQPPPATTTSSQHKNKNSPNGKNIGIYALVRITKHA